MIVLWALLGQGAVEHLMAQRPTALRRGPARRGTKAGEAKKCSHESITAELLTIGDEILYGRLWIQTPKESVTLSDVGSR